MTYSLKLEECTWKEIQAALSEGYQTVIVPSASVEQHGPHLPLNTDTLIAEDLAARIAEKLDKAFAAPVVRPGLSAHHMAFPGSFTLTSETFIKTLEEYCLSLAEHGFRYLVLISSHGGNFATINTAAMSIQEKIYESGFAASVIACADLEQYVGWQQDFLVNELGGRREEAAGHADVVETAMMLAIKPELVRMPLAEAGWMGDLFEVSDKIYQNGLHTVTQNGVLGDPRSATPEMGHRLLNYLSGEMAEDIHARILCRR
jgi:creatinine amidohydrolase